MLSLLVELTTVARSSLASPWGSWATRSSSALGCSADWVNSQIRLCFCLHARCVALVTCGPTDPIQGCCVGFTLHPWLCSILPTRSLPPSVRRCGASGASLCDDGPTSNSTGSLDC